MREPWFQRKFRFEFPVERIVVLLSRLRGTAARLQRAVHGIGAAGLTQRDGEAWSIQEHVGHLFVLDELHLTRLAEIARGVETLTAADVTNQATWDEAFHDDDFGDVFAKFLGRRAELLATLGALDEAGLGRIAMHPRLHTPMRAVDVAFFAAEHDDNHVATVERLAADAVRAPNDARAIAWTELPADSPLPTLERRRVVGNEAMISHLTLHAGCKVPAHAHANEQFACVLSGKVRFTLANGREAVLGAGEVLQLPAFAEHAAEAIETSVVLDVFSPPSETTGIDGR